MAKWVYMFTEGNATMRNLLGGKGANLAEMTNLGLPVPQGFTITTEACTQYYEDGREINDEIMSQIEEAIVKMEEVTGKKFGDGMVDGECRGCIVPVGKITKLGACAPLVLGWGCPFPVFALWVSPCFFVR